MPGSFIRYFIAIFKLTPRVFYCDFIGMPDAFSQSIILFLRIVYENFIRILGTFIGYLILSPRVFHCDFIWMPF